ncbi:MAG: SMC family ATPase [Elainella sp. Prado103]|jgi:exonuclease SbcC|nr:SMC family ATPase [Elainella sp. Prado103]
MEILSVALKNFKSHRDRQFIFQPGTNAICGENGAGKTSILEAIAWVLFNHRGVYKNEDLVRNGSGSAQVTVSFISHRDGRTYEVQRCTSRGYTIFDPQLGVRLDYRHIEEEVMPWLRQQLGVSPGTDLARLFANTIGVPQGTFTVDFLQPPDKRKQIFDSILKVEEYRQTNQQLLSLEKYGKGQVETLERTIAQYEESLAEWESLQARRQQLSQEIASDEATLQALHDQLNRLQAEQITLQAQAAQIQQLATQINQLTVQIEAKQQSLERLQQLVERSRHAVEQCTLNRESYQGYLQVEATLQQLNQQLQQRQAIWQQREKQQIQLNHLQQQLTRITLQLEGLSQSALERERLQPLIDQQVELEQQQAAWAERLNQLQAMKQEQTTLMRQLTKLAAEQAQLEQSIEQIQSQQTSIAQVPLWEQKRDRLQQQLSRIEAAKQFETELRQLVSLGESRRDQHQHQVEQALGLLQQMQQTTPLLSPASVESARQAIQSGVALNTELLNALWRILADLSEQVSISKLQQQLGQIKTRLESAYQARAAWDNLQVKQQIQQRQQAEIHDLQHRLNQVQAELATEAECQRGRSQVGLALKQLDNPAGRSQLLERDLAQQPHWSEQQQRLVTQSGQVEQEIAGLDAQLASFAELEALLGQQQQLRQTYQPAYQTYLQFQKAANQFAPLQAELQTIVTELQGLAADRQMLQTTSEQQRQSYDPQHHQAIEAQYQALRSQADRLAGSLPQQRKLLVEWETQIAQLEEIAQKRDRSRLELKQAEKIRKFITFARKVYKEAGPRITERYVQTVSREADRLFRELLNRPNVALEWTRDYEIVVQEGAHSRRLVNLSGGEQMCAALAVRLALLRVLADVDIAFFDEPTTNMDRPRRQSLAEAISNIKTFRQLFVISHDDTFEQVTENVIFVEREI